MLNRQAEVKCKYDNINKICEIEEGSYNIYNTVFTLRPLMGPWSARGISEKWIQQSTLRSHPVLADLKPLGFVNTTSLYANTDKY